MPNRILRDWTDSEAVNSLSPGAEVLFVRLIQKADDFGRYTANPKLLRPNLFPLRLDTVREADLDRWIAECVKASLVRLYEVEGKRFLVIEKFGQRVRADASRFPDPPPSGTCPPDDGHVAVIGPSRDGPPRTETKTESKTKTEAKASSARAAARGSTPSEAEWLEYARETWPDWPEADIRSSFSSYETRAWRGVIDWRAAAKTCYWRQEGRRRPDAPRALVGAHPPKPRPRPAPATETAALPPPPPGGGVWPRVLAALRPRVDERDFDTWFRGTRQVGELNGALRVAVSGPLFLEYIPREYGAELEEALKACGVSVPVEYLTDEAGGEA